jgi:hypothetical protein
LSLSAQGWDFEARTAKNTEREKIKKQISRFRLSEFLELPNLKNFLFHISKNRARAKFKKM